ncbi:hypothetical protein D3C78_1728340 [compost metagenome]
MFTAEQDLHASSDGSIGADFQDSIVTKLDHFGNAIGPHANRVARVAQPDFLGGALKLAHSAQALAFFAV